MTNSLSHNRFTFSLGIACFVMLAFLIPQGAQAATLSLSPDTGVYTVGGTFSARIIVNTQGKPINAAEGSLTFNPRELQVLSVSKAGSIFNLWTSEPSFSAGTVSFSGGSPSGYTGAGGTVATVIFKTLAAGTLNVRFGSGSVLAADGQGTNVLGNMTGGAYTTSAASNSPPPEYVAPANTPAAPVITSSTHPDPNAWYTASTAHLSWKLPSDVTAVRALLDTKTGTVPNVVYDTPVSEKEIKDLSGVNYFHLQFKNKEGWGRVAQYRLAVDASKPESFTMTVADATSTSPKKHIFFDAKDSISGIASYTVQIDSGEKKKWVDEQKNGLFELPLLGAGDHTIVADAFDAAGNMLEASLTLTIEAFEAPKFTDYPAEISASLIPVVKGSTRPNAKVYLTQNTAGSVTDATKREYTLAADSQGTFVFVPEARLVPGVYELSARAVDQNGAESRVSDTVRIAVQESSLTRTGNALVGILSVAIPLIALIVLLALLLIYTMHYFRKLRARLRKEITEAEQSLAEEFGTIINGLNQRVEDLKAGKGGKASRAESQLLNTIARELESAEARVKKEVDDIERVLRKR
jgi:hypothetical protein